MRAPLIFLLMVGLMTGLPSHALAQERDPASRQSLVDLAYVLGEAHGLRQVCEGPNDQFWRTRMVDLVETEQPDAALAQRLKDAFNTGFVARQGAFPACTPLARAAMARVMNHGKVLATRLARPTSSGSGSTQTGDTASRPR